MLMNEALSKWRQAIYDLTINATSSPESEAGATPCALPDGPVESDCMKALDYYRAGLEQRAPKWVPCRVLLEGPVRGDYPIGHTTLAEAGEHDCESNRYGAISVRATNGQMLGVKPAEFEPLEWRKND
jgi:hypothetical protein